MIRKLTVVLLTGVICLIGVTSALAMTYNEAPMLRTMVAAGELPPVEERLPEEPLVVPVIEEIGQYGGMVNLTHTGTGQWSSGGFQIIRFDNNLLQMAPDGTILPNLAKDWKISEDAKTVTLYLRKGIKWSDGVPFTADDLMFWWEDIELNDELTPTKPTQWCPGGEPMKARRVDDYTVQFEFSISYPTAIETLPSMPASYPKHYLTRYHINYNPDANELAKEEDYDNWWECIQSHYLIGMAGQPDDINLPVLTPWVLIKRDAGQNTYWERNPYYWRVDTAGNQLPYVDKVMQMSMATPEVVALKVMGGEVDCNRGYLTFSDYPVYKKNEKAGGYKVYLVPTVDSATSLSYSFNYTHKDPVLKKIFNDVRFRQATSLAINREEISKTVFYGKTPPWTAPIASNLMGFEDWMGRYYADFAPERAN